MKSQPINNSLGIFPKSWSEEHAGRIPGNIPIWVGILSELTEFGIFFAAYFIANFIIQRLLPKALKVYTHLWVLLIPLYYYLLVTLWPRPCPL